jgi:DNA-binding MarR family transcriptional regulator
MTDFNTIAPLLKEEIQQNRPFHSVEEALLLSLMRTAESLANALARLLKTEGLSQPQYNVLRILRGAGEEGRSCSDIGDRLVSRVPDITRLLDRLELRGLIRRERSRKDRRVMTSWITPAALEILARLDGPMETMLTGCFQGLPEANRLVLLENSETLRRLLKEREASLDNTQPNGGSE